MILPKILLLLLTILIHRPVPSSATIYNVITDFKARPDGLTNTTQAFIMAWEAACKSQEPAIIHVPKGRYLLYPVVFSGSGRFWRCGNPDITFRILGSLVGPTDQDVLGKAHTWITFQKVTGVTVSGGYLDARGQTTWTCKATSNSTAVSDCPHGANVSNFKSIVIFGLSPHDIQLDKHSLEFKGSSKIVINGLTSLNSHSFHVVIYQCSGVDIENVKVIAPGDSPNTDGIHVQLSSNVTIFNSTMKTGDDCISIGPGTQNMLVERVACGPGHGISIGSLGNEENEEGVQNVRVKKVVLSGTTNGLRIKSWAQPSNGFVQNIRFENVVMQHVKNPIIIDQDYCPNSLDCPKKISGIRISNITYKGVRGSSATRVAVQLQCSDLNPCIEINFQNINLTYNDEIARAECKNVKGHAVGVVQPDGCL